VGQGAYSPMVQASASVTATVPGTGWCSVVNGSGDACTDGACYAIQFGYGFGHAEGRGGWEGFGTGCGTNEVDDEGSGRGDGNACHGDTILGMSLT